MEDSNTNTTPEMIGETEVKISVGRTLREARERLGMTITEASNRIKFVPRQIEALEADDFAHLPEAAYIRGFVRSYARLLEIDAAPLLLALTEHIEPAATVADVLLANESLPIPIETSRHKKMIWSVLLVFVVVLALMMIVTLQKTDLPVKPTEPENKSAVVEQPIVLPAPVETSSATTVAPAADNPVAPVNTVPVLEKNPPESSPPQISAPVSHETAKLPNANEVPVVAPLHLVFTENTWAMIKDRSGKVLSKQVNQRGSELWLNGQAPFIVVIQRPGGARLYYQGREADLPAHTTNDMAKLVLE